ncbi:MAG: hypothetical protein H6735_25100 [Alphaproteobacteria bacterium]|nr:hypothetical protein [Alphaproteobacteria bacterium]
MDLYVLRCSPTHPAVWLIALLLGVGTGAVSLMAAVSQGMGLEPGLMVAGGASALAAAVGATWRMRALVLARRDDHLIVTWRGEYTVLPRTGLRASWDGSTLRLTTGDRAVSVPVLGGPAERKAVCDALRDLGVEQVAPDLSRDIRDSSLDGLTLRLAPIRRPIPTATVPVVAALVALVTWASSVALALLAFAPSQRTDDLLDHPVTFGLAMLVPALLAATGWMGWEMLRTLAVELAVSHHQLVVSREIRSGTVRTVIPLAALAAIRVVDGALELEGPDGRLRVVLPDRDVATHEAVADLLRQHRARLQGSPSDVPAHLGTLARQATGAES